MANKVKGNGRFNNRAGNKPTNRNATANSNNKVQAGGVRKKIITKNTKNSVQDARQKILQKKRTNVVDARDVLAQMAKGQDARNKLNKLRDNRDPRTIRGPNSNVKVIGQHIVQKTDRNGQISLSTAKKTKPDINLTIRKQLGLVKPQTQPRQVKKVPIKRPTAANQLQRQKQQKVLQNRVNKLDLRPLDARLDRMERLYSASLYKWTNPDSLAFPEPRPRVRQHVVQDPWQYVPHKKPIRPSLSTYVDLDAMEEDEDMPMHSIRQTISLQGSSRSSNIHSRLDSHPLQSDSHGILSNPTTKVVVPAGHRIVVSNLQNTVTQDDIKELFEDIGQLLAAHLVRPGVAEVIYKNLKDAQKAVDTYHNRQLDGQPMKCLLVNRRPLNQPTAPALSKQDARGMVVSRTVKPSTSSSKLVPDIGTIHKVLFQRK